MNSSLTRTPGVSRRAVGLEYASILLAAGEAVGALVSGLAAGSVALTAFGTDSVIELLSAFVVLNQLRALVRGDVASASAVHRAHRTIAILFFALALYIVVAVTFALSGGHQVAENDLGLFVCVASLVLMPVLALAKRRSSASLGAGGFAQTARLMRADASETALCAVLSLSTLVGVGVAWSLSWWWADPVVSLVVVVFALREGREAWTCDPI